MASPRQAIVPRPRMLRLLLSRWSHGCPVIISVVASACPAWGEGGDLSTLGPVLASEKGLYSSAVYLQHDTPQESSSQQGRVLKPPEEQPCTQGCAKEHLLTREMVKGISQWPAGLRDKGRLWVRSLTPGTFCSSLLQDMLPMPGDPTQGTGNYNIEDFADLGMFPPFSE